MCDMSEVGEVSANQANAENTIKSDLSTQPPIPTNITHSDTTVADSDFTLYSVAAISVGDWGKGASVERRRLEDRRAESAEGVGCGEEVSSKRQVLVHSGCYFAVELNRNWLSH